jgi:hypothetical protein
MQCMRVDVVVGLWWMGTKSAGRSVWRCKEDGERREKVREGRLICFLHSWQRGAPDTATLLASRGARG